MKELLLTIFGGRTFPQLYFICEKLFHNTKAKPSFLDVHILAVEGQGTSEDGTVSRPDLMTCRTQPH